MIIILIKIVGLEESETKPRSNKMLFSAFWGLFMNPSQYAFDLTWSNNASHWKKSYFPTSLNFALPSEITDTTLMQIGQTAGKKKKSYNVVFHQLSSPGKVLWPLGKNSATEILIISVFAFVENQQSGALPA